MRKENNIPVVSVSDRGKRIANYGTCSRIYTVDYEIKGHICKMLGKTIVVGNEPCACSHRSQNSNTSAIFYELLDTLSAKKGTARPMAQLDAEFKTDWWM